jgi:ketosteroid isomerase-like protein
MTGTWRAAGLAIALAAAGCTSAPPPAQDTAAAKAKLEADATSWFGFLDKGDTASMANLYEEDARLTPPGLPAITGRTAIKTYFDSDLGAMKGAGLAIKNGMTTGVDVAGDIGWISGIYTVVTAAGMTVDSGNYLSVHKLTNGQWLYVRDIWNSDRPPAK